MRHGHGCCVGIVPLGEAEERSWSMPFHARCTSIFRTTSHMTRSTKHTYSDTNNICGARLAASLSHSDKHPN